MLACLFTEPHVGATYADILAAARAVDASGFDGFFRSDHYLSWSGPGEPGPTDAWVTLAGLARETGRVRLGTLLTAATFRLPGPLAIAVAEVDAMSGGRIELGLGAGWFEAEHAAYGIPFPSIVVRFERLEEQLQVIRGLWETPVGERFSFHGRHYQLIDSPALPKPLQSPRPPLIVGGVGARRTPALAAQYADEYNVPFASVDTCRLQYKRARQACAAIGRNPESLRLSAAVTVCCGRNRAEVRRRAVAIGRDADDFGSGGVAGTPSHLVDALSRYGDAGASRLYLQVIDLRDIAQIELLASQVVTQL
ncbi:MAG TPA: LLM class F420-dependent oxidoreductase [Acidimicrobiales bacterium]|nr:LLM class F420-dependent oxidoreductase [Acidimicrobiales bacterium]